MAIFQESVLKTISQDEGLIAQRWAKYQNFLSKVEFVKSVKEEKYQDGFLHDIFEECLGYTLDNTNPQEFNLEREKKNETDSKKADGVIYVNSEVLGIVELKDQKSKNLDAVEAQAFNYHASHSNSKYIIISNFDELRFYIDKKTAYEKFSLFYLTYEEFKKLHLLLSYESIKEGLPLKLKEKSTNFEAQISKELYRDFSIFRNHLFENIVKNNYFGSGTLVPSNTDEAKASLPRDKSTLLRLTQKLCDRIIFILFAEDRGLLRHNTIKEIREEFRAQKFTSYTLYDIYKFYFNAINEGNEKLGIPKYNGGLFAKDELLDTLTIDDAYLDMEAQKLSDYDFMSDVGVNILGHIFEQSLTDLEEIQADIDNADFDKKQGKRKKDGVFYTPEYITRYIVENTLGRLCEEKKKELFGSEVLTSPTNTKKLTKAEQAHKQNILDYREWLTNLKILDPACGSGAFLNQALEFLIKEHTLVRDMLLPFEDLTLGYEIEKEILEHNLYGVDINEDAVEIAKLSLWLRTAHKGRELTSLAEKIVCANSLLNMPFDEGSFDVVIGNPPYVRNTFLSKDDKEMYEKIYYVADGQYDLYVLFNELALKVSKINGLIGFIQPNKFLSADYGIKTINFIVQNSDIELIKNVSLDRTFEDASVYPYIFIFKKTSFNKDLNIKNISIFDVCKIEHLIGFDNELKAGQIVKKIDINSEQLANYIEFIKRGIPNNKIEFLNNGNYCAITSTDLIYPYFLNSSNQKISYLDKSFEQTKLREFGKKLILLPRTILKIRAVLSDAQTHILDRIYYIALADSIINQNTILLILNSKITTFYYNYFYGSTKIGGGYIDLKGTQIANLPIPKFDSLDEQTPFIQIADKMLALNKQLQETKQNFTNELGLEKLTKKLQNFEELEFEEFIKEYAKAKKLKFADKLAERNFKQEWQAIFENDKILTCRLKDEIAATDKEIDAMVYKLYDLSDEEIKIIEGI